MKNTKWEMESIGTTNGMRVSITNGREVTFECHDEGLNTSFTFEKEDLKSLINYLIKVDQYIDYQKGDSRGGEEEVVNQSISQMEQKLNQMRSHSELNFR